MFTDLDCLKFTTIFYFSGQICFPGPSHTLSPLMVVLLKILAPPSGSPTTASYLIQPTLQRLLVTLPASLTHLLLTVVHLILQVLDPNLVRVHDHCHRGASVGSQEEILQPGAGARVGRRTKPTVLSLLAFLTWVHCRHSITQYRSPQDQSQGQVALEMRNLTTTRRRRENSKILTMLYGVWQVSGSSLNCGGRVVSLLRLMRKT